MRLYQRINPGQRHMHPFCNKASFYGEELLAPHLIPMLEDHPLSAFHDCLFTIFTATFHIGGCSYIHNLMHHAVVTGTHSTWFHHCRSSGYDWRSVWDLTKISGKSGKCLFAWCIFVSAEKWNAKYVAALLPLPSKPDFGKLQKCRICISRFSPRNFLFGNLFSWRFFLKSYTFRVWVHNSND